MTRERHRRSRTDSEEDVQGTLTLWFHENRDNDGNPSNKVYGVSNCHVLRRNTTVGYEHKGGAPMDHVRVCGMRRLHRGLVQITQATADHIILADVAAREVVKLEAKEVQDVETATEIRLTRRNLDDENQAIADLGAFHGEVVKYWSHRNIGHVQYAAPSPSTKTAHDILRTGLRSWLLRRRSRIHSRETSLISELCRFIESCLRIAKSDPTFA